MQELNPGEIGEKEPRFIPESEPPPEAESESEPAIDQLETDARESRISNSEVPVSAQPDVPAPPPPGEIPKDFFDIKGLRGLADKVIEKAKANGDLSLTEIEEAQNANRAFQENKDRPTPETK